MRKLIGIRLEEERERIGKKKGEMAAIGGVAGSAYTNYLEGKRAPDAEFLSAIAAAGADVNYILTGNRANQISETNAGYSVLSREESALLDNYRHIADKDVQLVIKKMVLLAVQAEKNENKSETAWDGIDRRHKDL